jgi:rod shape-determining protein MreC
MFCINSYENLESEILAIINQRELIDRLKSENEESKKLAILSISLANELNLIISRHKTLDSFRGELKLIRVISYAKFGDFHKFWINFKDFNQSKVYGILENSYVAGIVINKNSKPLALLNGDEKASYAVNIGQNEAPAIIRGASKNRLIADFIPSWIDVQVGDEVVTSGLDNIFFAGLKVGKVKDIEYSQGYKVATIEPYAKLFNPSYFYVIDK